MNTRIEKLLRTNTALVLLLTISIGVFILLSRGRDSIGGPESGRMTFDNPVPLPTSNNRSSGTKDESLAGSPLRHMPAPESFKSFTYETGATISIILTCADEYYVVIIFPAGVDYRTDLLSAKYNTATKCASGKTYSDQLSLGGYGFVEGETYYVVRASQAKKGTWHDPY